MSIPTKIVLVSSNGQCGIHEYSKIVVDALRQIHADVDHIAIAYKDHKTLRSRLKHLANSSVHVIFEYTPEIFETRKLMAEIFRLRRSGAKVTLSVHESSPGTIYRKENIRHLRSIVGKPYDLRKLFSIGRKLATRPTSQLLRKLYLRLIGRFSNEILVHSAHVSEETVAVFGQSKRTRYVPHFITRIESNNQRNDTSEKARFIVPGFINPTKRILEVIEALPADTELTIAGTIKTPVDDASIEYQKRIVQKIKELENEKTIRLVCDYDQLENELRRSDVAIFYYERGSQSGMASLAIGAGLSCIFSTIGAFDEIRSAGMSVDSVEVLNDAMVQMSDPDQRNEYSNKAVELCNRLSPIECAKYYLSEAN